MSMADNDRKSAKPANRKPATSPDDLVKSGRATKVELTEDELGKVSGGAKPSTFKAE